MLLVLAEHAVIAPARRGTVAVARDGNGRLKLHPFVELAVDQAFLSAVEAHKVFADPRLADIHTVDANLDRAVIGEQVCCFAPQAAIDVVAEGLLQLLDGTRAFQFFDAGGQRIDFRVHALLSIGGRLHERENKCDENGALHGFCLSRINFIHSSAVGMTGVSTRRRIFHCPSSRMSSSS